MINRSESQLIARDRQNQVVRSTVRKTAEPRPRKTATGLAPRGTTPPPSAR